MSEGLLVVTAHPDDEVLIAGGTLAACASLGIKTTVACLTRGEAGPIAPGSGAHRDTLAQVRAGELLAACAELGVDRVLSYAGEDGGLRWSDAAEQIVRELTRLLDAQQPTAVITFGEDGLYYHPDHIATFDYTCQAVSRARRAHAVYRSVWPEKLMSELVDELRARGLPDDLWNIDPAAFGAAHDDGCFAVDVRPFVERKLRALRCHRTQLTAEHAFTALPLDLAEHFLGTEHFAPVNFGNSPAPVAGELRFILDAGCARG